MCPTGRSQFNDNDVITGRDSVANSHPGNLYFRELCRSYKKSYNAARRRSEKAYAINSIIQAVKRRGGRFMTLDDLSGDGTTDWIEMDEDSVHRKVSHNLRHRSMTKAQLMAAAKLKASGEAKEESEGSPASASPAMASSNAKPTALLDVPRERRRASLAPSPALALNSRRPSIGRDSSHRLSGSLAPRRHGAPGQLYMFDARFRETFVRDLTDGKYLMFPVAYHIVRGGTTEIHGANLVMRQPPPLPYGMLHALAGGTIDVESLR